MNANSAALNTSGKPLSEMDARQMFSRWSDALKKRNPHALTELYADNAVLIPTL